MSASQLGLGFVAGGALDGGEARLTDQRDDLVYGRLVDVVRGGVDVLLEERAPEVVRPPVERDLSRPLALGEPRGLHVRKIVEVETGGGEHPEIRVRAL